MLTAFLLRPQDFLSLRFDFDGFDLVTAPGRTARLVRTASPAYIIVQFPTQHIAEQAYLESDPNLDPGGGEPLEAPGDVDSRLAGASRLVFRVPDAVVSIDYLPEALLQWPPFTMNLAPQGARPPAGADIGGQGIIIPILPPPPAQPTGNETAIEAPYRLFISPNSTGGWAHSIAPVDQGTDRTELWHTRLGVRKVSGGQPRIDEQDESTRTIRTIWTPDFVAAPGPLPPHSNTPFRMSLDGRLPAPALLHRHPQAREDLPRARPAVWGARHPVQAGDDPHPGDAEPLRPERPGAGPGESGPGGILAAGGQPRFPVPPGRRGLGRAAGAWA